MVDGSLRRRSVVGLAGLGSVVRVAKSPGVAVLAGMLLPAGKVKAEPITVCIAVAAAVGGLIAAHNRGDGGLGAALTAILDYQRSMTAQLSSIQAAMAKIVEAVQQLPDEMRKALKAERLEVLHLAISEAIGSYRDELRRASTFTNQYSVWQKDPLTQNTLRQIDATLTRALQNVKNGKALGPVTAAYLPAAASTAIATRAAMGEAHAQIRSKAQDFLDVYQLIESEQDAASTQSILGGYVKERDTHVQALRTLGVDIQSITGAPIYIKLDEVTIQDYEPRRLERTVTRSRPRRDTRGSDPMSEEYEVEIYASERIGQSKTIQFVLDFTVSEEGTTPLFRVRQYSSAPVRTIAVPVIGGVQVVRALAKSDADKVTAALASEKGKQSLDRAQKIAGLMPQLNLANANVMLCLAALHAIETSRAGIYNLFGAKA